MEKINKEIINIEDEINERLYKISNGKFKYTVLAKEYKLISDLYSKINYLKNYYGI